MCSGKRPTSTARISTLSNALERRAPRRSSALDPATSLRLYPIAPWSRQLCFEVEPSRVSAHGDGLTPCLASWRSASIRVACQLGLSSFGLVATPAAGTARVAISSLVTHRRCKLSRGFDRSRPPGSVSFARAGLNCWPNHQARMRRAPNRSTFGRSSVFCVALTHVERVRWVRPPRPRRGRLSHWNPAFAPAAR
jgi:hypothetical protein